MSLAVCRATMVSRISVHTCLPVNSGIARRIQSFMVAQPQAPRSSAVVSLSAASFLLPIHVADI